VTLTDLEAVVARLQTDGRFYRLVLEWPDELCRHYALSSDEVDALQSGSPDALIHLGIPPDEAYAVARAVKPPRPRWTSSLYSRAAQFHRRP
jgi:hypothetical protein